MYSWLYIFVLPRGALHACQGCNSISRALMRRLLLVSILAHAHAQSCIEWSRCWPNSGQQHAAGVSMVAP